MGDEAVSGELIEMTREEYDAIKDRVNYSTAKYMAQSPLHYRHAVDFGGGKDTDGRKFGRVAHIATFEEHLLDKEVVVWEGGTRKGANWDAFRALHMGREIIKPEEMTDALNLAAAVHSHPWAAKHLAKGDAEITVLWTDAATGIRCKARLDWLSDLGSMVDLKSTQDGSTDGFNRQASGFLYHAQVAMYSDAVWEATKFRVAPYLLTAERHPPHVTHPFFVPETVVAAGRHQYRSWLRRIAECREAGRWPGYSENDEPSTFQLTRWADNTGEMASEHDNGFSDFNE